MKSHDTLVRPLSLTILAVSLAGCHLPRNDGFEPLSNGYGEVTYSRGYIHRSHRIELQYRDEKGKRVVIWPALRSSPVIEGDTAVFVGLRAPWQAEPDPSWAGTGPRLFAVKSPGPVLDITTEVLYRWSQESGQDFATLLRTAQVGVSGKEGDGVGVLFGAPTIRVHLDWTQVSDIMREVKAQGVERKDPVWNTTYIESKLTNR